MATSKQPSTDDGRKSWVLVLGLDLGTTSFKISMLAVEEQLDSPNALQLIRNPLSYVIVLENFPGHHQHALSSVPTCLSYSPKADLPKWGHEADKCQSDEDFDSDFFVANWKLALHQSHDPSASRLRKRLQCIAKRLSKGGLEAFAEDFSRALATFLFEDHDESPVLKRYGTRIDSFSHIDVVVAVPPGWSRQEHEILSNAVARGFGETRSFRIFRASETECVLRSWMQDPEIQAKNGEILLLLDLGGGTVCISAFRCEVAKDGTLTWAHMESHSLSAGSEIVSEEFAKDFKQRLSGVPNVAVTSKLVHKARKKFDERKVTVGERLSESDLQIKVPGLKRDITKDFFEDRMYFSGERILGYFRPSQNQILRKIEAVTDRLAKEYGSPPKYCLAAGAYANNILFRKGLRGTNHHNMDVSTVPNSADSVARGACLTRLHGNFNQFAGGASKHSIAILTYIDATDAIKLYPYPATRIFNNDGMKYTPALLWAIRKGDPIRPNHVVEESGNDRRRRTFEQGEDIIFTDTMFISDSEIPKEEEYTVLKFNTTDPSLWRQNMDNLRARGITGKLYDVTWDMNNVKLKQKDGTSAPMRHTDIAIDRQDPRPRGKRRVMYYKFLLHVSSTDIQVSIQSFHTRKREKNLIIAQKQISMSDKGEFESAALQEEYNNIGAGGEISEDVGEEPEDDHHSEELSTALGSAIQHPSSHCKSQASTTVSMQDLEMSSSLTIKGPLAYVPQLQGTAPAVANMLCGDPKRVALTQHTHIPYSTPIARQGDLHERGRHAAPQISEPASRASSRYRTRSSTPMRTSDQSQQSRNGSVLRESQSPAVASQDAAAAARPRGRTQSSLRTPVVPAKKRQFAFEDDVEDDEE